MLKKRPSWRLEEARLLLSSYSILLSVETWYENFFFNEIWQRKTIFLIILTKNIMSKYWGTHSKISEQSCLSSKTNLLHRLQTQTLPNATSPIGKINPFSKISGSFELLNHWCDFDVLPHLECSSSLWHILFITQRAISNQLGVTEAEKQILSG